MSLLFLDGFDHYDITGVDATTKVVDKWQQVGAGGHYADTGRRAGSLAFRSTNGALGRSSLVGASGVTTGIMGFAYNRSVGNASRVIAGFTDQYGISILSLLVAPSGVLYVVRPTYSGVYAPLPSVGGYWTLLGQPTENAILGAQWYFIEWKASFAKAATAEVTIRVNEEVWAVISGVQTLSTSCPFDNWNGGVGIQGANSSTEQGLYDDLYVVDTTGGAPFNDFLGDVRIDPHYPTQDGVYTQWATSTGSDHYALVDDDPADSVDPQPDDDVTYNATSTVGAIDTFVCEDFKASGFSLLALQYVVSHKKLDAGSAALAPVIRIASTDTFGTDYYPSEGNYYYDLAIYTTNPVSGLAWNESDFNAMEIGYKKTI